MTNPGGHAIRPAEPSDHARLAAFTCAAADAPEYVHEVDNFVQRWALHWFNQMTDEDRRLLLLITDEGDLVAAGAHYRHMFWEAEPYELGRMIQVIAIDARYQGHVAANEQHYSDIMLTAIIDDLLVREPDNPIVTAVIHRDNARSLALFHRHGFTNTEAWPGDCVIVW